MRRQTCTLALCLAAIVLTATSAYGQRGGRGSDDDRRGGFGGFGGGDFRERMLSGMDANRNGFLEPQEIQGRSAGFVEQMARGAGLDMNRPLEIRRLVGSGSNAPRWGSWGRGRDDDDDDDDDDRRRRRRDDDRDDDDDDDDDSTGLYVRIPRFGSEEIVGFGLHPRLLAGRIVNLQEEFDERILGYAERTMDRYDENENSILDREEWEDVRWRDRDPKTADLDNNGRLTMAELASLFGQDRDRERGRDRDDRRRRDDDDDDDDDRRRRFGGFAGGFGGFGGGFPGWGDRGRDRDDDDDDDGGRGRRGRGGFGDPSQMIARLDRDDDGKIEPDEVDPRMARFLGERFEVDFSEEVSVEDLTRRMSGDRNGRNDEQRAPEVAAAYKVEREIEGRKSYRSATATGGLPQSLSDKDRNKDGQITLSEYMERASRTAVEAFAKLDRNGDGLVTAQEAAQAD